MSFALAGELQISKVNPTKFSEPFTGAIFGILLHPCLRLCRTCTRGTSGRRWGGGSRGRRSSASRPGRAPQSTPRCRPRSTWKNDLWNCILCQLLIWSKLQRLILLYFTVCKKSHEAGFSVPNKPSNEPISDSKWTYVSKWTYPKMNPCLKNPNSKWT